MTVTKNVKALLLSVVIALILNTSDNTQSPFRFKPLGWGQEETIRGSTQDIICQESYQKVINIHSTMMNLSGHKAMPY